MEGTAGKLAPDGTHRNPGDRYYDLLGYFVLDELKDRGIRFWSRRKNVIPINIGPEAMRKRVPQSTEAF